MCHNMKLWDKVTENRSRRLTNFTKNQFGFMPKKSTTLVYRMQGYMNQKNQLHMVFINMRRHMNKIPMAVML